MQKNADKTVTLTEGEVKSLKKLVASCHDAISSLPSDGDFLGWDNYRALQMWDEKLKGHKIDLADFTGEEEDDEEEPAKKKPKMVDEWLDAYGKKRG